MVGLRGLPCVHRHVKRSRFAGWSRRMRVGQLERQRLLVFSVRSDARPCADAESVRRSHHGQLRLLDARFVDSWSAPS